MPTGKIVGSYVRGIMYRGLCSGFSTHTTNTMTVGKKEIVNLWLVSGLRPRSGQRTVIWAES